MISRPFLLFILFILVGSQAISQQLLYDGGVVDTTTRYSLRACPPSTTAVSCNSPASFNITASGYVGDNPTAGDAGCNPCCYAGADLDCDGLQDVPFSVENSKWYRYCNSTGAPMSINFVVDEPGTGSSCNLQGAAWVGASLSTTVMDCGNSSYSMFDSNPGGAADGFSFAITVPTGQCAYIMIDGYAGTTCSGVTVEAECPVLDIDLISFEAQLINENVILTWSTASETNSDYFQIMKSNDGIFFSPAGKVSGAGYSTETVTYEFQDKNDGEISYYYLEHFDFNGESQVSKVIAVSGKTAELELIRITNLLGQEVPSDYSGIKIMHYSNGTTKKVCGTIND